MRVGVVGCGYWGSKHVRVLSGLPEVSQVVAIDRDESVTGALARSFPALAVAPDVESALDGIDAAVVATPPRTHAPVARLLLEAGKHVLVEKPMATSVADAEDLVRLAGERGLTLMTGHTFEYSAPVRTLRETLQSGELGRLHYVDTARLNLGLYQGDVNVVWDLAPHDVSILNHLLDSEPTSVHARGMAHAHAELEDVAYLNLHYGERDVMAQVHVSWLDPCKVRRFTVVGSRRMAVWNDLVDEGRIKIYDKGVTAPEPGAGVVRRMTYRNGGIYSPHIPVTEPLREEDEHFLDCIATGREPRSGGASGLAVVRVLEAAQESLRTGRSVDLAPSLLDVLPVPRVAADALDPAPLLETAMAS